MDIFGKVCTKCHINKTKLEFGTNSRNKDGLSFWCKECHSEYNKNRYKGGVKEKLKSMALEHYKKNKQKSLNYMREYRLKNLEKFSSYKRKYFKDPIKMLAQILRSSIGGSFSKLKKSKRTIDILGCSFEEFKAYIESKWESWMNWENYGNRKGIPKETNVSWDLDHIIPLATAKTIEDIEKLNHYTNFQPLCSYTNRYIKRAC